MYFTYDDYVRFYGDERLPAGDFERIALNVDRVLDAFTTGVDNYRKLKEAFPTDEDDVTMVKVCACRLADLFYQMELSEKSVFASKNIVETENGVHSKLITSTSAGNESISYATGTGSTLSEQAASNLQAQHQVITDIVKTFLSGISDANGVNLLYMGRYPNV